MHYDSILEEGIIQGLLEKCYPLVEIGSKSMIASSYLLILNGNKQAKAIIMIIALIQKFLSIA